MNKEEMKFLTEEEAEKAKKELEKTFSKEKELELTEEEATEMLKAAYLNINGLLNFYLDISEEQRNIITLWVIGTYYHKNFTTFPYLFINAMRSSGKTRLMKLLEALSKHGQLTQAITEATMFRTTGTLLLDEFEGITRKGGDTLRELLNSSYKQGTKVMRMKKKKTMDGENQVVETFRPYRPIAMANIWGMEEVLGDRCINVTLEKSMDLSKIKLMEDFDNLEIIRITRDLLEKSSKNVVLCSVVTKKNIQTAWNTYIKQKYDSIYTHTLTTTNYIKLHKDKKWLDGEKNLQDTNELIEKGEVLHQNLDPFFDLINDTGIDGRYLELFFPLFLLARDVGEDVLTKTLEHAKLVVNDKKIDEVAESKDVLLFSFISKQAPNTFYSVIELTNLFRMIIGEGESDWLNSKWMGRALKRLNLVAKKQRVSKGIQVMLHVQKAKDKEVLFKPKDE